MRKIRLKVAVGLYLPILKTIRSTQSNAALYRIFKLPSIIKVTQQFSDAGYFLTRQTEKYCQR